MARVQGGRTWPGYPVYRVPPCILLGLDPRFRYPVPFRHLDQCTLYCTGPCTYLAWWGGCQGPTYQGRVQDGHIGSQEAYMTLFDPK